MKDERFLKIVPFGQPSKAKWKAGLPRLGLDDVVKKDLTDIRTQTKFGKRIRNHSIKNSTLVISMKDTDKVLNQQYELEKIAT